MVKYEYKVVPAPKRGEKAKGVKGTEARFAHTMAALMNELGAQGWDYQRADTLPCEERSGLTGKTTTYQNMLVFRRVVEAAEAEAPATPLAAPVPEDTAQTAAPALTPAHAPQDGAAPALGPADNAPEGAAKEVVLDGDKTA